MTQEQKFFDNQKVVVLIAKKLHKSLRIELEDAVAWGHLGLWQACQKDHPVWEAYVRVRIAGAIKDGARILHRRFRGDVPHEARQYPIRVPFKESMVSRLQSFSWPDEAPSYSNLNQALAELSRREAEILRRNFIQGHMLKDIAQDYGITEARISQIRKRALLKVRKRIEELEKSSTLPP